MMGTIALFTVGTLALLLISGWMIGERGSLMRPTTRTIFKAQGLKNMLNFNALHSYIYARWTREYVVFIRNLLFPIGNDRRWKKWTDGYHGKVLTREHARAIITLNRNIPLRDLEQVIPYPTARNLVLNGPPDVVVYECACRNSKPQHCEPTQVCMAIGKPFTDFLVEHHPSKTRRLSQADALQILEQARERGSMHTAWFKDVVLNRFYAICNCCRCCCAGAEAMNKYGAKTLSSSGYVATVDAAACDACGTCEKGCHFNAITVDAGTTVNWDRCMGCGVCETKCPNNAVSLVRDEKKGVPFDVRLMA